MTNYMNAKINRRHKPYSKFKAYMDERNITQAQLAEIVGKSKTAINQNLNGTGGDLSLIDVRKICLEFNISSDDFFINQNVS